MAQVKLVEQFKNLLMSPFIGEEERKNWMGLLPEMNDSELKELIHLMDDQQKISLSLSAGLQSAVLQPAGTPAMGLEDFLALSPERLMNGDILKQVMGLVSELEQYKDVGGAVDLLRHLLDMLGKLPTIAQDDPELAAEYKNLVTRLRYLVFVTLPDEDSEELLKNNLRFGIESGDFDLKEKIADRLSFYHDDFVGGERRKNLIRAVRANEEKIGGEKLESEGGATEESIIKNWLRRYELFFEKPGVRGALEEANFVNQDKNVKKLSEADKDFLLKLFRFYDYLMFQPAVVQANTGSLRKITQEKVIPKDTAEIPVTPEDIIRIYNGLPAEEEAIKREERDISKLIEGNKEEIKNIVYENVFPKTAERSLKKIKVVAALRVAAQEQKLEELILDKRFQNLLIDYLRRKNRLSDVDGFKINPTAPSYFVVFLRFILEEHLNLQENESARVGMHLVNIIKKGDGQKYAKVVYFDQSKKEFSWVK